MKERNLKMSFSSQIKDSLCRTQIDCEMCRAAEIAGMLRFTGSEADGEIRFSTENAYAAERLTENIKKVFGITVTPINSVKKHSFLIDNSNDAENVSDRLENCTPFACCKASFVRGAFLGGGSITDPDKSYHIEFCTRREREARVLCGILSDDGFAPKITERKGKKVVYMKECEQIADLLGYMGADNGALEMFTIQVEKQMRNAVNRQVNCENANMNKSAIASSKHTAAIHKIKNAGRWEKLPEVLKEIGELREQYPDISLKELGEMTEPPIGKSGVNHRLNRIIEIAETISAEETKGKV